ncbi:MAG: radical SAM protein [Bacteroidales bacterium]|nr:radical SAM protein [Bacteroidales bacterium]
MKTQLPHITFETTSVCNLKCRYCYNIWKIPGNADFEQFNSYKQAKKTLKRLFKIAEVSQVTFTGGEPFAAERFNELVLFTRMNKKSVAIISNGNKASSADYKQMLDLGVNLFELPLHSPTSKEHDFMTDTPGSWQKSLSSIKALVALEAYVVAVVVITKANFHLIKETLIFIKNLGINRIMLNRFNIGGQGISEKENLWLTHEEINKAYRIAAETGREHNLMLSSNVCTPMCVLNPSDFKGIAFSSCSPDVKKRPLTLDIHGNLRFCNHSPTVLGNIFQEDLEKMLSSEEAKKWSDVTPEFCTQCDLYSRCMGGCRAASEQLKLSLSAVDPIVEIIVET